MREITVYSFDELSEDAKEKAVAGIREKLAGDWWDSSDIEDISAVIVAALAQKFSTPGWDQYGVDDYPGIPAVSLEGWDLDRGQSIVLKGQLTRDNAPALPWVPGIGAVELDPKRDHTYLVIEEENPECTCPSALWLEGHLDDCPGELDNPATVEQRTALDQAVRDAMEDAWKAGYAESEYKTSDERAREWIEGNDPEFFEDGTLHT